MASAIYDSFLADVFAGNCNTTHTYRMTLHTSSYVPDRAVHNRFDDVTNQVTGTGYTAGGEVVALTTSTNTTAHTMTLTIASASWASSTITARYAVIRRARGGAASADELVAVIDNKVDLSSSNTTFAIASSTWTIPMPVPV